MELHGERSTPPKKRPSRAPAARSVSSPFAFFTDWLFRLRHARWFNTQPAIRPMSIMEHGYVTAVLALLIAEEGGLTVDRGRLLTGALLHDLEEAFTGDVNTLMKQRLSAEVKEEWKEAARGSVFAMMAEMSSRTRCLLCTWWESSKDASLEGQILRAADYLAMYLYANEELGMGNISMAEVVHRLREEFIRPLPEEPWLESWRRAAGV